MSGWPFFILAAEFRSVDFSLCAFPRVRKSKPHRLKPVLPGATGPLLGSALTALANSGEKFPLAGSAVTGGSCSGEIVHQFKHFGAGADFVVGAGGCPADFAVRKQLVHITAAD
jgi:hypothetical protein